MTKGTKTFLIFSVSLIAIGIALMSTGLFMGGSLFTNFSFSGGKLNVFNNSSELKEGTIPCDAFDSVCVDTSVTDICFEKVQHILFPTVYVKNSYLRSASRTGGSRYSPVKAVSA